MMATFRTVERPTARPCDECSGVMQPAKRYERTQTVGVHCCFECGADTPPLYPGTTIRRVVCQWCGVRFTTRAPAGGPNARTCSDACKRRSAAHHQMMVRQGQQNRRRVS